MSLDALPAILVNSVIYAGTYFLVGLGWVLVFRTSRLANFATGNLIVLGVYFYFFFYVQMSLPFLLALLLGLLAVAVTSIILFFLVLKPLTGEPLFSTLILTFGLGLVISHVVVLVWGGQQRFLEAPYPNEGHRLPGGAFVDTYGLATLVLAILSYIALSSFFKRARTGIQMRAAAESPVLSAQSGVNANKLFAIGMALAVVLSSLGGISIAHAGAVSPDIQAIGLRAIAPALIGGLDSIKGLVAGSLIVAFIESLFVVWLGAEARDAAVWAVLLVVVIIRPHGIFGTREVQRI